MTDATDTLQGRVSGSQGRLFNLIFVNSLLTIATLGVYSFWMRTRIRRWLWSSLKIGGAPVEYTGRALEKLMGFVFAAVLVAIWLGLVMMVLVWISLNLFQDPTPGALGAAMLLLPIYFWAQYRGMRYLLNHTTWRGLSFWMVPGAWGYAWRALVWWALVILTLGILVPMQTRALWRYRTERAFWGNQAFTFDVPLGRLYAAWLPAIIPGIMNIAILAVGGIMGQEALFGLLVLTLPATLWGMIWWNVRSFGILASGITLENGPQLVMAPRVGRVIGIHLLGYLATSMALSGVATVYIMIGGAAAIGFDPDAFVVDPPIALIATFVIVGYLFWIFVRGAFKMVFTTFPLIQHAGETLSVQNATAIAAVQKGEGAHMADADGFANLFDSGVGI